MIEPTLVDFVLEDLDKDQNFELVHELGCLKIYLLCLAKWNDSSFGRKKNFGLVEEYPIEAALITAFRNSPKLKEGVASELLENIQRCKPKIKQDCLNFLDDPFQCEFSSDELPEYMMYISASLRNLLSLKADMILDVKVKIESLEDDLDLFKEVFEFTKKWCKSQEDLLDVKIRTQAWACHAACLLLLYWMLDVEEENMAPRMDVILSDLLKKISLSNSEVSRMYLAALKASKPSAEDSLMAGKLVLKFVEFLKDNLQVDPEKDDIQMLFIDLIFLITFLMDRPEVEKLAEGKLISTEADAVVNEAASLISLLSSGEMKVGIAEERNFLLPNFLEKADAIKTEVRKIYCHLFLDPSSFNFPRINILGFIDSLVENSKECFFHFPKHQIMVLQEELLSLKESNLRGFSILVFQNTHKDIKDLWKRIANMAYNAEIAISSFAYTRRSLWHDILCLSDVIEEVKLIKGEVKRIFHDRNMYDIPALNSEMSSSALLPLEANIPMVDKVVVGFKNEAEEIRGRLLTGSKKLDFISIVGMPGLGKTTLANKVYSDPLVWHRFDKCAWCTISQTFDCKRILLDISKNVVDCDGNLSNMEEADLAQKVYRSLKGQKYLIVMDDIWDVRAWDALKMSFPDDNKGSRIIFTTRIHKVVLEVTSGCSPFHLNPLSQKDSWELLEKKLFDQDRCPSGFVEIGKHIARNCKGLPLAVVLIAGLLKKKLKSLSWWKQVGESLDKLIGEEGFRDLLELSYNHLPEHLKPCFLYLGSFAEDEEIRVKKLTQLWISEGFIERHEIKSLEVVAEQYLMDLVARSLVIVTKRRSSGEIKAFIVHDLLHEFCTAKGEEEKFSKVIRGNGVSYMAAIYAHYRVCIQTECWRSFLKHVPSTSFVHSLLSPHPFPYISGNSEPNTAYLTFPNFKFLRVLDLDLNLVTSKFPETITELILLRYLAIACCSDYIPPSIKRLKNLETLHLYSPSLVMYELPLTTWEMQKLRHINATLIGIPLDFCGDIPPLENVQTFSTLILSYEDIEMVFRATPKVRKLKCNTFRGAGSSQDPVTVKLDFLSHLESLNITHVDDSDDVKLRSCAFYLPSTLRKLTLENFGVPWSDISPIANLPNLEVLKLDNAFCGEVWNLEDEEFSKLKFLKLQNLDIKHLNASDDSLSCLKCLVMKYCQNLKEIPFRFGSILTLKMIQVKVCGPQLESSVRKIRREQLDMGNQHLEVHIWRHSSWDFISDS